MPLDKQTKPKSVFSFCLYTRQSLPSAYKSNSFYTIWLGHVFEVMYAKYGKYLVYSFEYQKKIWNMISFMHCKPIDNATY